MLLAQMLIWLFADILYPIPDFCDLLIFGIQNLLFRLGF